MKKLPLILFVSLLMSSAASAHGASAPAAAAAPASAPCGNYAICTPRWPHDPLPPPHFVCPPNAMCFPLLPILPVWPWPIWPIWPHPITAQEAAAEGARP